MTTKQQEIDRIKSNLDFISVNPTTRFPNGWIQEVMKEAGAAGLIASRLGCNCPTEPFLEPIYGGDMADVF